MRHHTELPEAKNRIDLNNVKTFSIYSDSTGSWIAIKKKLLSQTYIEPYISRKSYMNGSTVYLSVPDDSNLFFKEISLSHNMKYKTIAKQGAGRIRKYTHYKPTATE